MQCTLIQPSVLYCVYNIAGNTLYCSSIINTQCGILYCVRCNVYRKLCTVHIAYNISVLGVQCSLAYYIFTVQCNTQIQTIALSTQYSTHEQQQYKQYRQYKQFSSISSIVYIAYIETSTIMTGVAPLRRHSIRRTRLEGDQQQMAVTYRLGKINH